MLYRMTPKGEKISTLGYGCMRLPRDVDSAKELLLKAVDSGINYFDTAWIYSNNEVIVGESLKSIRERVNIATKLPLTKISNKADFDSYLTDSLSRLQTSYLDFYLLHMLTSFENFMKFREMGVLEWGEEKKRAGLFRNFGFSYHGTVGSFKKIVDAYPWDICMIQYNYLDIEYQAGTEGLRYANAKNIPVIVMEPLRGGRLISLPKKANKVFHSTVKERSNAEWALRWLWNQHEVTCVLSGMETLEQLSENVEIASSTTVGSMNSDELDAIAVVRGIVNSKTKVNCTGCEYCLPCPKNVNIPLAFSFLNGVRLASLIQPLWVNYALHLGKYADSPQFASQCISCGKCTPHCPQGIDIPKELRKVSRKFEKIPPSISILIFNLAYLLLHDWLMCKIPDFLFRRNKVKQ